MKPCERCGKPRVKGKARAQRVGKMSLCFECINSFNRWFDRGCYEGSD